MPNSIPLSAYLIRRISPYILEVLDNNLSNLPSLIIVATIVQLWIDHDEFHNDVSKYTLFQVSMKTVEYRLSLADYSLKYPMEYEVATKIYDILTE